MKELEAFEIPQTVPEEFFQVAIVQINSGDE
jgi:hypothetical protein